MIKNTYTWNGEFTAFTVIILIFFQIRGILQSLFNIHLFKLEHFWCFLYFWVRLYLLQSVSSLPPNLEDTASFFWRSYAKFYLVFSFSWAHNLKRMLFQTYILLCLLLLLPSYHALWWVHHPALIVHIGETFSLSNDLGWNCESIS